MTPRFKLRWKILISFLGVSLLPLLVALWLQTATGEGEMRQGYQTRLTSIQQTLRYFTESALRSTQQSTRVLAALTNSQSGNAPAWPPGHTSSILTDLQFIALLTPQETRVFRTFDDFGPLPDLNSLPLIAKARKGETAASILRLGDHLALVAVSPLTPEGKNLVIGARVLDRKAATSLQTQTGAHIGFFADGQVRGTSWNVLRGLEPDRLKAAGPTEVRLEGKLYSVSYLSLGPDRGALIALSLAHHQAAILRLQERMLEIGLGALLVALLLGFWLSARIVRPLGEVVDTLDEIAKGDADLTEELPVRGRDEIASLSANFNRFIGRLRQMVRRTDSIAHELAGESQRIQATANQVNRKASAQKLALEQSTNALWEIERASSDIAANTSQLHQVAEDSGQAVRQMEILRNQLAQHMGSLFSSVSEVCVQTREASLSAVQLADQLDGFSRVTETNTAQFTRLAHSLSGTEKAATDAAEETLHMASRVTEGLKAARDTADGVDTLCATIENAGRAMSELERQSSAIGQILNLVNDFADQTSLLALNASVIASQAGEEGQGFAVVAQEIRELAERTSRSVDEISEIISDLQLGCRQAGLVMQEGTTRARKESVKAKTTEESLEEIRQAIDHISDQIGHILLTTQEQVQVSQHLSHSAEKVTALSLQATQAANRQADEQKRLTSVASNVETISVHGKNSLHDHMDGSRRLRSIIDRMREMVDRIHEATSEQAESCQSVAEHFGDLRHIGEDYSVKANELDRAVELIGRKSALLKRGIRAFRT